MILNEIRKIAKLYGVKTTRLKKEEVIKAIQREEGNYDCYASATTGYCDQQTCLWREDCLSASMKKAS